MHLLSIFLIAVHFATLHAFPNFWASGPKASSTLDPSKYGETFVVVHPIDPNDSETIEQTVTSLEKICGSDHVENLRSVGGDVSWKVTLTDRESLRYLTEHPWLRPDQLVKKTLVEFSRRHEKRSALTPRDDPYYNVVAKDYNNDDETKATREFLKMKITDPSQQIYEFNLPGTSHIIGWGNVQLSDAAKGEVEAYQGVTAPLGDNDLIEEDRAVMSTSDSERRATETLPKSTVSGMIHTAYSNISKRAISILKRAVTWTKQQVAGWDLVMVSQPKEMKDEQLKDFVYDENAGTGTWIYVIDAGVAYKVQNKDDKAEFPNAEPLQTQNSRDAKEKEDADDSNGSHGTMVASKALGQKYGVAKRATLVSVKVKAHEKGPRTADFIQGLDLAANHIAAREDRQSKSVIISSLGCSDNKGDANLMRPIFDSIFSMGVPFISSSGNLGDFLPINKLPKVLVGSDMPIIVVGAADNLRQKAGYSQDGPQLTLYAPGGLPTFKLTGQSKDNKVEQEDKGTSFAAPIVAGVIATYFNYDPPLWDGSKSGKARVQEIKELLVKDASSWDDEGKVRSIWNGATRANHQSVGANNQQPPPTGPTKALNILGQYLPGAPTFDWLFLETDFGHGVECRTDFLIPIKTVPWASGGAVTYPGGVWPLTIDGQSCEYKNAGDNAGRLFCGDRQIECVDDPSEKDEYQCDGGFTRQPVFTCAY